MPAKLLEKVRQAIERYRMLDVGDGVVAAVSGGPDSVALLDVLTHLSAAYRLKLTVAHLNHGLRPGPADEDEALVHRLSEQMGLACESMKVDVAALSRMRKTAIEETAREERYRFLEEIRARRQARKIALGHHAGDQAETVLMNLLRGSGPDGLRGMKPVREGLFIRPLLGVTRQEIAEYLENRNLPYRIDQTNAEENCFRNTIRRRLIPELKSRYNPQLEENLCHTAEILGREGDYLDRVVEGLIADPRMLETDAAHGEIRIDIGVFLGLHEALQGRMIKHLLLSHARKHQGIGYTHIRDVRELAQRERSGGALHLPFGLEVRREYGVLVLCRRTRPARVSKPAGQKSREASAGHAEPVMIPREIGIPGQVRIDTQNLTLAFDFVKRASVRFGGDRTVFMDYACVVPPLAVRTPQPGDRIQPLGMTGMKKLKRHFIDRKIPVGLRGRVPLLVDGRSVIWIVGQTLSERVKITDKTTKILKIEMIENI